MVYSPERCIPLEFVEYLLIDAVPKYNDGIPENSRYATHEMFKKNVASLKEEAGLAKIKKVKELTKLAETGLSPLRFLGARNLDVLLELGCSVSALALAWIARNPNTSTVILGASKPQQIVDNLKALKVLPKLTPTIMDRIEEILDNKPSPPVSPLEILF